MSNHTIWYDCNTHPSCFLIAFDTVLQPLFSSAELYSFLESHDVSLRVFFEKLTDQCQKGTKHFELTMKDVIFVCSIERKLLDEKEILFVILQDQTDYFKTKKEHYIFQTVLDSFKGFGIMICDENSKILLLNDVSTTNDKTPKNDILGKEFTEVYGHQSSGILDTLKMQSPIIDKDNVYLTPTGRRIVAHGSVYPIKKDDHLVGVYAALQYQDTMFEMLNKISDFQQRNCKNHIRRANNTTYTIDNIIGHSDEIRQVITKIKTIAPITHLSILIYGETGTGKELFAQSIHNASPNQNEPFVAVNCAAIPDSLLESILFGTVKGAFTGSQNTPGLFESAGNGTLFLDEINLMSTNMQAKLLRVLQENTYTRIGDTQVRQAKCRIISALNKPPQECIEEKTLRADLYYRISTITLTLPTLRERKSDIEALANHFVSRYTDLYHLPPIRIHPSYLDKLLQYDWPGNIRELQHTIESSVVLLPKGEPLTSDYLPQHILGFDSKGNDILIPVAAPLTYRRNQEEYGDVDLRKALEEMETKIIRDALERHHWNVSKTAIALNLSRSNLQYRMNRLNILSHSV